MSSSKMHLDFGEEFHSTSFEVLDSGRFPHGLSPNGARGRKQSNPSGLMLSKQRYHTLYVKKGRYSWCIGARAE